jgi:hypothetical protein
MLRQASSGLPARPTLFAALQVIRITRPKEKRCYRVDRAKPVKGLML